MARVHPKIAQRDRDRVLNNQSLLNDSDRALVEQVRSHVNTLHQEVEPLLNDFNKTVTDILNAIQESQKTSYTHQLFNDFRRDFEEDYLDIDKLLEKLEEAISAGDVSFEGNPQSIEELREFFKLSTDQDLNNQIMLENLVTLEAKFEAKNMELQNKQDELENHRIQVYEMLEEHRAKSMALQDHLGVKFYLDENFELTKISKGKNGPAFSVVFAKKDGEVHPFILYRGKEYEGEVRQLGQGGFGKVKLAQDYQTNELVAVKVQLSSSLPESILQQEKYMLNKAGHFKGDAQRSEQYKDYIFQSLHYGKELESLVNQGTLSDDMTIEMLKQAAMQLQKMHENNLIHRDIKLENFMWDEEMSECIIIDLAFVENVNGDEIIYRRDEAGSQSYLAPEALEGNYSKRSDIYAFGVLMNEVLEKKPELAANLKNAISTLTRENIEDRATSLKEIIDNLNTLQVQLSSKQTAQSRPKPLTSHFGGKRKPLDETTPNISVAAEVGQKPKQHKPGGKGHLD